MSKTSGISTPQIFLFCFVFAKLAGWIDWSWFWVLTPLWIPFVFLALLGVIFGFLTIAVWVEKKLNRRKARKRIAARRARLGK